MRKPNGLVLFEGASVLDGAPIVVVATLNSKNVKTGNMVQTWILRADVNPVEASKQALDDSICGGCPHRHSLGGACYVNLGQAPLAVWKAYKRGSYPKLDAETAHYLKDRFVRMGSYGDPAAVPATVWHQVVDLASGWTGYTHQAGHPRFNPEILAYCMVSSDTPKATTRHLKAGYRTFRVKTPEAPLLDGEVMCPAETGVHCADCQACSGSLNRGQSIAINVHGSRSRRYVEKFSRANLIVSSHA